MEVKKKRVLSVFITVATLLAILSAMLTATVTATDDTEKTARPEHLIINQVYGSGMVGAGAVSNGFIELYNPTDTDVNLSGKSLQYCAGVERGTPPTVIEWRVFPLEGTIPANSSFLIVSDMFASPAARYTIPNYDMVWSITISNRAFSVALADGTTPLTDVDDRVIDLVGVANSTVNGDRAYFYEHKSYNDISQQRSARRIDFADYDENNNDFDMQDYRAADMNDSEYDNFIEKVKPRYSGDGAWGEDIFPTYRLRVGGITFSHTSGFYDTPFDLTVSADIEGGVIRYTTDGSEPTAASPVYTNPIDIVNRSNQPNVLAPLVSNHSLETPISKGTVIKAKVFNGDKAVTQTHTRSYFVGLSENYRDFPVISLSTDRQNLFGSTGIYSNPHWRGRAWERPVHFEIIEPDGSVVSANAGTRMHGADSRHYPQKTFRIYMRREYDSENSSLKYDLFKGGAVNAYGEPVTEFKRFLIHANAQTQLQHQGSLMTNPFVINLSLGLNMLRQGHRPAIVFLNGEYWGYYTIYEYVDERFIAYKYGLDNANIGILNFAGDNPDPAEYRENPTDPDVISDYNSYMEMYNWFDSLGDVMSDDEYAVSQTFLDIDNFIDYWAFNMWTANGDWPGNNIKIWRYRLNSNGKDVTDGRWRYILYDMDHSFGSTFSQQAQTDTIGRIMTYQREYSTLFFKKLLTNNDFRCRFIARSMYITNTIGNPPEVVTGINAFAKNIEPIVLEHAERWNVIENPLEHWRSRVQRLRTFAETRQNNYLTQINDKLILPNINQKCSNPCCTVCNPEHDCCNCNPCGVHGCEVCDPCNCINKYCHDCGVCEVCKPSTTSASTTATDFSSSSSSTTSPEITTTYDTTTTSAPSYILGDVDGINGITVFDALEILKYLVGMESKAAGNPAALITSESKQSGKPAVFDALEILKKLVGMPIQWTIDNCGK